MTVLLVELTGYTDASTSAVYRYATAGYTTAPADDPAHTHYEGRVLSVGSVSRSMFAAGQSGARANPRTEVGVGVITLANTDGELDTLFGGGVSFREREVRILEVQPGAAYSTAVLRLRAVISQAALRADTVEVSIKDRLYELASPHSTVTYGGTNALPAGVDGGPELAGKLVPQVWGKVFAVAPPCVNTSRLIYQLSGRALQSVEAVYDGGNALTPGATYADQAAMEATAPSAGEYRVWLAGGMMRLGTSPVYRITADCTGDSAGDSTAAQLLQALAAARGVTDVDADDVTQLDADNDAVLGVYVDSEGTTTLDLMDQVARSVGAYYGFDRAGTLRMQRYGLPTGATGGKVVAQWNAQAIEAVPNGEDVPTETVRVLYARYWQPLSLGEFAGAVGDADRADLSEQWRVAGYSAAPDPNPYQRPLTADRETVLTTEADAEAEAERLHAMTAVPRRTFAVSGVTLADPMLAGLDIDDEVELRWDRFGLGETNGTSLLVIAMTEDMVEQRADLLLWG